MLFNLTGASFAKDTLMSAARGAADIWSGLMPNIGLDFETPSMQLLAPTKLFCETVFKTPGFDGASCATELGCKHAGRAPPPTVEILPAEQVSETVQITGPVQLLQHSATCHHNVQFGDRFMQLGAFRLAHMDDHHFSISNKNGWTSMVWKHDGNESPGPRKDFNVWNDRGTSKSRAILFGFQFVQIGKRRLGAVDDDHFSLAHQNGWTQMVWKSDGNVIKGPRYEEYTTWDRPEGPAQGILYGDWAMPHPWIKWKCEELYTVKTFRDRSLLGLCASTFYSTSVVNIMGILKHNGNPLPEKGLRFRDDCSTGIKELCHVVLGVPKPCVVQHVCTSVNKKHGYLPRFRGVKCKTLPKHCLHVAGPS